MEDRVMRQRLPWIMFGDFNKVINNQEKMEVGTCLRRDFLKSLMENIGAIDLGFKGCSFI